MGLTKQHLSILLALKKKKNLNTNDHFCLSLKSPFWLQMTVRRLHFIRFLEVADLGVDL